MSKFTENDSSGRGKSDDPNLIEVVDEIPLSMEDRLTTQFRIGSNISRRINEGSVLLAETDPAYINISVTDNRDGVSGGTIRSADLRMIKNFYISATAYDEDATSVASNFFLSIVSEIAARTGFVLSSILKAWLRTTLESLNPTKIEEYFRDSGDNIRIDLITWLNSIIMRTTFSGESLLLNVPDQYFDGNPYMSVYTQDRRGQNQVYGELEKVIIPNQGIRFFMTLTSNDFGDRTMSNYLWNFDVGTFGFKESFAPYSKVHTEIRGRTNVFQQVVMFMAQHSLNNHSVGEGVYEGGVSFRAILRELGNYDLSLSTYSIQSDGYQDAISEGTLISLYFDDSRVIEDDRTKYTVGDHSVLVMHGWKSTAVQLITQQQTEFRMFYADYLALSIQSDREPIETIMPQTSVERVPIGEHSLVIPLYINMFASRCIPTLNKLLVGAGSGLSYPVALSSAVGMSTPKFLRQLTFRLIAITGIVSRTFRGGIPSRGGRFGMDWLHGVNENRAVDDSVDKRLFALLEPLNTGGGSGDIRYLITCINSTFIVHALVHILATHRTYLPWNRNGEVLTGVDTTYMLLRGYWEFAEGVDLRSKVYNLIRTIGIGESVLSNLQNQIIDLLGYEAFEDN